MSGREIGHDFLAKTSWTSGPHESKRSFKGQVVTFFCRLS